MTKCNEQLVSRIKRGVHFTEELIVVREYELSYKHDTKYEASYALAIIKRFLGIPYSCKECGYKELLDYLLGKDKLKKSLPTEVCLYAGWIPEEHYLKLTKDFFNSYLKQRELLGYPITSKSTAVLCRNDYIINDFYRVVIGVVFKPTPVIVMAQKNFNDSRLYDVKERIMVLSESTIGALAKTLWEVIEGGIKDADLEKEYFIPA